MINIQKAVIADKLLITQLTRSIYKEHYLHLWHEGGARWYMEEYAYADNKIESELLDSNIEYFIAVENGECLGYMKIVLTSKFIDAEFPDALEIERIYFYKRAQGRGLGKRLIKIALEKAYELGKELVFLKAMDTSKDVIGFYKKMGFSEYSKIELPLPTFSLMKHEYRGMLVLIKKIMD